MRAMRFGMALLLAVLAATMGGAMGAQERDTFSDTWAATDALGRTLPGPAECGPPRPGKCVGIFYFLWLGHHSKQMYDISKILAADPQNPPWGPRGAFHFWGEPHLGYYRSEDEFVLRKHAQMLTDAGVDVLFLDVTNAFTYDDNVRALCRVFTEVRKTGRTTPQIAFLANSHSARVVQGLYDRFYAKDLYPELWFRWKGKPLLLAPPEGLGPQLLDFFTLRQSWAWSNPKGWFGDGRDKWPWVDHYPQQPGWTVAPDKPEEIAVCVAQHPTSNIGRSFHDGKQPSPDQVAPEKGLCFAEQWRRALEVDPELVFITGWNEWVAQRFVREPGKPPGVFLGRPLKEGESYFVDQYTQEFSRDIEPMRGGHGDSYYYQMVEGIRRFKGVRPRPKATAPRSIRLDGGFAQWRDVGPEFRDDLGDTSHRGHPGWEGAGTYTNASGRNDFDVAKVARDRENVYFYVSTREAITPPAGANWMLLLLDTDGDRATGWEGYDFVVNRTRPGASTCLVERHAGGGWRWERAGEARFALAGSELHLAVPRRVLGLDPDQPLRLGLKWADNVPESGNLLDFIDQGDVAPNARFSYRYEE